MALSEPEVEITSRPGQNVRPVHEPRHVLPTRKSRINQLWGRRFTTLADQGMSSVSNVLAVVLVARVLSAADFGRFVLGYTMLTLILGLSRSYFGTRVSLATTPAAAREMTRRLIGAIALLSPVLIGAVIGISAIATNGHSLGILLIVAIATPIVCIQDILRFGAAAAGKPSAALISDGLWVFVMAVPFFLRSHLAPGLALALWSFAAILALVVIMALFREWPRLRPSVNELKRRDHVSESVTFGTVVATVGSLWVLLIVSRVIGPAAAGSLRGAATAMGPINVLMAWIAVGLTPALARRARSKDLSFCGGTALILAAGVVGWGAFLLVLPHHFGVAAFGKSWPGIRSVLPWTITEYTSLCIAASALMGLKVRRRARKLIWQRVAPGVVTIIGGTIIAIAFHHPWPVAAVFSAAALVSAIVAWYQLTFDEDGEPYVPKRVPNARGVTNPAGLT